MRFLLWLAFAWLMIWLWRGKKQDANIGTGRHGSADGGEREGEAETMRQCASCGVHFPASEAVFNTAGEVFCCEAHRSKRG